MSDTTDKPFVTLLKDLQGDKYLKDFTRRQIPSRQILEWFYKEINT